MGSLNLDLLRNRCQEILESCARLEKIADLPEETFLKDQDQKDIAAYRLLVAIEAALSICYHLNAKKNGRVPETYASCFEALATSAILDADLSVRLQKMARFRNLLVHVYWNVDERQLYRILKTNLEDLKAYVKIVARIT